MVYSSTSNLSGICLTALKSLMRLEEPTFIPSWAEPSPMRRQAKVAKVNESGGFNKELLIDAAH